jgi:hypothetical protein
LGRIQVENVVLSTGEVDCDNEDNKFAKVDDERGRL